MQFLSAFSILNWTSVSESFSSIFNHFAFKSVSLFTPEASWAIDCNCYLATERFFYFYLFIYFSFEDLLLLLWIFYFFIPGRLHSLTSRSSKPLLGASVAYSSSICDFTAWLYFSEFSVSSSSFSPKFSEKNNVLQT